MIFYLELAGHRNCPLASKKDFAMHFWYTLIKIDYCNKVGLKEVYRKFKLILRSSKGR